MFKQKVKSILLNRAEGPTHLCGSVRIAAESPELVWQLADQRLKEWAVTAPSTGAYDKCDFIVEFTDGSTYRGRFDLQRQHRCERNLIQRHIIHLLNYLAGLDPAWMDKEKYRAYIAANALQAAEARSLMNRYEIPADVY